MGEFKVVGASASYEHFGVWYAESGEEAIKMVRSKAIEDVRMFGFETVSDVVAYEFKAIAV